MKKSPPKSLANKLVLAATIIASGMAFLDGSIVNIALPTIQDHFQTSLSSLQWIVNGYLLMLSSLILIAGALSDRFGRKKLFVYGIALFSLASLLCGISQSTLQLIIFRCIQGIGGALMVPGSLSIINTFYEEKERGKIIGLWSGVSGGIAALGPFLGGWLVQTLGWQSIFFVNLPLGVIAFILAKMYVPESKSDQKRKVDIVGALLIFLSLLLVTYGLIQGPAHHWDQLDIIYIIAGVGLFILFGYVQIKVKHPLIPLEIFSSRLVVGSNLVTLFLYGALSAVTFFLVLNFQQAQKYSALFSGIGLLPTILLITFLSGPAGSLADRIGPRIPMILGPFLVGLGMSSFALPSTHANYFLSFLPGLVLFGLGMSIVIAPLTKSALAVDHKYSGAASGVNNAVARVAGLLAVAIFGAIIQSIFTTHLNQNITDMKINSNQKMVVMQQSNKLMGINLPSSFSSQQKLMGQQAIDDSFVSGFKWVMALNGLLAFLSAFISYLTIR